MPKYTQFYVVQGFSVVAAGLWDRDVDIAMLFGEDFLRGRDWKRKSNGERLILCVEWCTVVQSCLSMRGMD